MRRLLLFFFLLLAAPAYAKDELVLAMTQAPGTMNPLISSMLAKSLISNMTARPFTVYDPDWKLVCLLCTEIPTLKNGKARIVDLPDDGKGGGKKGMEVDIDIRPMVVGAMARRSRRRTWPSRSRVGKHPLSGVASSEGYKRILKLDIKTTVTSP